MTDLAQVLSQRRCHDLHARCQHLDERFTAKSDRLTGIRGAESARHAASTAHTIGYSHHHHYIGRIDHVNFIYIVLTYVC